MVYKPYLLLLTHYCRMKENNIIIANDGIERNVLILVPPMVITLENAHRVITTLDKVLKVVEQEETLNYYQAQGLSQSQPSSSMASQGFVFPQPWPSTSRSGPTR